MQIDMTLWELKQTSDWKILGHRRTMRLKLKEMFNGGGDLEEEIETHRCSPERDGEFEASVSFRDAWKALGRRKQYRSPPQSASSTPTNRHAIDLVDEFKAIALSQPRGLAEQYSRSENASDAPEVEPALPIDRPHISTLYFLSEMEKFK
jgi:hypothetical protein